MIRWLILIVPSCISCYHVHPATDLNIKITIVEQPWRLPIVENKYLSSFWIKFESVGNKFSSRNYVCLRVAIFIVLTQTQSFKPFLKELCMWTCFFYYSNVTTIITFLYLLHVNTTREYLLLSNTWSQWVFLFYFFIYCVSYIYIFAINITIILK